jgi:SAM-dependent methyltransferase
VTDDVARYYDSNTRGFLKFGQGGNVGVIRRAVWGPGVATREQAFRYSDDRLIEQMPEPTGRVLDLGCGVGASLEYMTRGRALEGVGVTLSEVQVGLANERLKRAGVGDRVRCIQGDFTKLPDGLGTFDFAYAIEAFLHSPSAEAFFREASGVLRPGGVLCLVDDFASERLERPGLSFRERRWAREFREGWNAGSLIPVSRASEIAASHGFELTLDDDVTEHVELRRPRDLAITALVRAGRRIPTRNPWWLNLLGGNALQMLLMRRLVTYRIVSWQKR